MAEAATRETLGFQTEVKQLLKLMIHSLYSNKEIFLRELISNASDACDKLRFEALTAPGLFEDDADLKIRVAFDRAARTITVADNGIGMSRQEVIDNIGTIARSGTREFLDRLNQAGEHWLPGYRAVGAGPWIASLVTAAAALELARRHVRKTAREQGPDPRLDLPVWAWQLG